MTPLIFPLDRLSEAAPYLDDETLLSYLGEGQSESFEGFEDFDLLAFDWYDIHSEHTETAKLLLYLSREKLIFFCESEAVEACVRAIVTPLGDGHSSEELTWRFFQRLLAGDMDHLDRFEEEVGETEAAILSGPAEGQEQILSRLNAWRRELLRMKHYYEQLSAILDALAEDEEQLLTRTVRKRMRILDRRLDRYLGAVRNLQEVVSQLREAYQSQLSIQQNELMKLFTLVTAVFLPLTLLTGWYGMNFAHIPELTWRYGYPAAIVVSVVIVTLLLRHFKKKRWL